MGTIVDVLRQLGARPTERRADAPLALDASAFALESLFGGPLAGEVWVTSESHESIRFLRPPELAACGTLWMPDVNDEDTLREAVADAHATLGARLETDVRTLAQLGLEARLEPPVPRAVAGVVLDGYDVLASIGPDGELQIIKVDDVEVDEASGHVLSTPEEGDAAAARAAIAAALGRLTANGIIEAALDVDVDMGSRFDDDVDSAEPRPTSVTPRPEDGTDHLSEEELGALHDVLGDEDEDLPPTSVRRVGVADEKTRAPYEASAEDAGGDDDDEPEPTVTGAEPPRTNVEVGQVTRAADAAKEPLSSSLLDAFDDDEGDRPAPPVTAASLSAPADADDDDVRQETLTGFDVSLGPMSHEDDAMPEPTRAVGSAAAAPKSAQPARDDAANGADGEQRSPDEEGRASVFDDDDDGPATAAAARPASHSDAGFGDGSVASSPPTMPLTGATDGRDASATVGTADDDAAGFDDFDEGDPTRASKTLDQVPAVVTKQTAELSNPAAHTAEWAARLAANEQGDPSETAADDGTMPVRGADLRAGIDRGRAAQEGAVAAVAAAPAAAASPAERAARSATGAAVADAAPAPMNAPTAPAPTTSPPAPAQDDASSSDVALHASGFDDGDDYADFDEATQAVPADEGKTRAVFVNDIVKPRGMAPRDDGQAARPASPSVPPAAAAWGEPTLDVDPEELEVRADALEREARTLRDRAQVIRASRIPQPASVPPEPAPAVAPPAQPSVEAAALVSMASIDIEEVLPDTLSAPSRDEVSPDRRLEGMLDGRTERGAASPKEPPAAPRPQPTPAASTRFEEGVSFAAVRAALLEEEARDAETQLAEPDLGDLHDVSDTGDVFGHREPAPTIAAPAVAEKPRPRAVGLVVEDPRARDRLKKRLQPRIAELVEASDVHDVTALPELARLAAVVFIRPRSDERTLAGLNRLARLSERPRIIVLSSDTAFDQVPQIDLRVPLGERASEVAQQVLDGLVHVGVPVADAPEP